MPPTNDISLTLYMMADAMDGDISNHNATPEALSHFINMADRLDNPQGQETGDGYVNVAKFYEACVNGTFSASVDNPSAQHWIYNLEGFIEHFHENYAGQTDVKLSEQNIRSDIQGYLAER